MPKITREAMRLYAVSDRSWLAPGESLAQAAETLLRSGVTCFQLREKELDRDAFLELARSIKPVCRRYNVPFLINDDVEVALACDADGVHVGQSDESLAQARRQLGPDKIIGVSCHNVAEARAALEGGADYLGCGSVFATDTKQNVTRLPVEELARIRAAVGELPIVAIGGIHEENLPLLRGSGAYGVALVSALFAPRDKEAAARQLLALSRQVLSPGEI